MKVRKLLCALLTIAILIGAMKFSATTANATSLDEADLCLMDAIELMLDEDIESLNYNRIELSDYELNFIGYGYEIKFNGKIGFALMIKRTCYYEVTELYLNKNLPYDNINGVAVYLTPLSYIEYFDEQYIDIENDLALNYEQLLLLKEKGFGFQDDYVGYEGSGDPWTVKEYITYDSRTLEEGRISGGVPSYFDVNPALTGTCAVQAGSVVLGHYARYYPELVPSYTVGMPISTSYLYFGHGSPSKIQPIIEDLYVRMGTNVGGAGTTATGFRNGLESYVKSKGRKITYTSIVTNKNLNYDSYKSQIANLKPSVLFFNTYNAIKSPCVYTVGNVDDLERRAYPGMHVMIGYGYKKYVYYKNGVSFKTDYYLEAYTGVPDIAQGFVKLYENSIIQEGYAINIT